MHVLLKRSCLYFLGLCGIIVASFLLGGSCSFSHMRSKVVFCVMHGSFYLFTFVRHYKMEAHLASEDGFKHMQQVLQ